MAALLGDSEINKKNVTPLGIAHQHIKDGPRCENRSRRIWWKLWQIMCHSISTTRSPMLYAIHNGYVEGYHRRQNNIVHLVASAERFVRENISFVFTDGHAEVAISRYFEDLNDLNEIDWNLMKFIYWYDTPNYPDRKRRRQAEFLVYLNVPWQYINEIGVRLISIQQKVENILDQASVIHRPRITIHPEWYY